MNHIEQYLLKLEADEAQLQLILDDIRERKQMYREMLGMSKKVVKLGRPKKQLVAETIEPATVIKKSSSIRDYILHVMATKGQPQTIKQIVDNLKAEDIEVKYNSVYAELHTGVGKGLYIKVRSEGKTDEWRLNEKKTVVKPHTKSEHRRPNYGIERAIANFVNSKEQKGTFMSSFYILENLKEDFPQATEMTINSVLSRWSADKKPGMTKHNLGGQVSYTFKQPIKI